MITYVLSQQLSENSYGRLYPLTSSVSSKQLIFDEKTKSRRYIRCARGERSIFEDEQSRNALVERIIFRNGILNVHENDSHIISFLDASDWNDSKENRDTRVKAIFKKENHEQEAKELNEEFNISYEAETIARNMDFESLLDFCRSARINIDRSADEIKFDVFRTARNEPEYFLDVYNDPVMKRVSKVRKAEEEGILYFDITKRQAFLVQSGKKESVKVLPLGVDMRQAFAEWTFENEGKETYGHIEKLMNGGSANIEKKPTRGRPKKS
tara:strand:+ start:1764 stop:2570 length:807 start_codon:yes stop_codon:yes gene_type:complete